MELICPQCGELWDHDSLHEEAELRYEAKYGEDYTAAYRQDGMNAAKRYQPIFNDVARTFRVHGCAALHELRGTDEPCEPCPSRLTAAAIAAYEACGDDMDGAAALMGDFEAGC